MINVPIDRPVEMAQFFVRSFIAPGDICIDATAGNGNDTLFLCRLVGKAGTVIALDIQPQAIEKTTFLLTQNHQQTQASVILDSHANIAQYAKDSTLSAVMYNLGWLPGGSHHIQTRPETTIASLQAALPLLKSGGIISLCIYSGKDTGFQEKEAVLSFAKSLKNPFSVLLMDYWNKANNPPINLFIIRK